MKKLVLVLVAFLSLTNSLFPQRNHNYNSYTSLDFLMTPLSNKIAGGVNFIWMREFAKNKFCIGFCVEDCWLKPNNTYGLIALDPHLNYFHFGIPIAYRVASDDDDLFAGLFFTSIGWSSFQYTDHNTIVGYTPKAVPIYEPVGESNNIIIQPGISFYWLFLNLQISYRYVIGNTDFSTPSGLSGFEFKVGFGAALLDK